MTILRDYQTEIAINAALCVKTRGAVYLAMQVRTGKTLTALKTAELLGGGQVLFITRKAAISSIEADMAKLKEAGEGKAIELTCVNYESLHHVQTDGWDVVICDEAHCLGQYPRPSIRAEAVRMLNACMERRQVILLSGTPSPESYCQLFHQYWAAGVQPWGEFKNFYQWHKQYGKPQTQWIAGRQVQVYNECDSAAVMAAVKPYVISYTQSEAGFKGEIVEKVVKLPMPDAIRRGIDMIRRDKVLTTRAGETILADTAAKEMGKVHQLSGGTVITESGLRMVVDRSKAEYIAKAYAGMRIAVFYVFQAEREALEAVMGKGHADSEAFNRDISPQARIYFQVVSGREGVNLSTADVLVMYNVHHAAVSYWQARARIQTQAREGAAHVHWLMFDGGLEAKIYAAVLDKRDYTTEHYKRELL